MKNFFKKCWPILVNVGGVAVTFLSPAVQAWASANPGKGVLVLAAWAQVLHFLPSPASTSPASKF